MTKLSAMAAAFGAAAFTRAVSASPASADAGDAHHGGHSGHMPAGHADMTAGETYAVGELTGLAGINGKAALEGTFLGPCIVTGRVAARSILGLPDETAPAAVTPRLHLTWALSEHSIVAQRSKRLRSNARRPKQANP